MGVYTVGRVETRSGESTGPTLTALWTGPRFHGFQGTSIPKGRAGPNTARVVFVFGSTHRRSELSSSSGVAKKPHNSGDLTFATGSLFLKHGPDILISSM